jgi:hypothetical protein
VLGVLLSSLLCSPAHGVTNGNFEAGGGSLDGWTPAGGAGAGAPGSNAGGPPPAGANNSAQIGPAAGALIHQGRTRISRIAQTFTCTPLPQPPQPAPTTCWIRFDYQFVKANQAEVAMVSARGPLAPVQKILPQAAAFTTVQISCPGGCQPGEQVALEFRLLAPAQGAANLASGFRVDDVADKCDNTGYANIPVVAVIPPTDPDADFAILGDALDVLASEPRDDGAILARPGKLRTWVLVVAAALLVLVVLLAILVGRRTRLRGA